MSQVAFDGSGPDAREDFDRFVIEAIEDVITTGQTGSPTLRKQNTSKGQITRRLETTYLLRRNPHRPPREKKDLVHDCWGPPSFGC